MSTDDLRFPLDDLAGPAPRITAAKADALITAALDAAAVDAAIAPDVGDAPTGELPPRRARYRRWAWLAVALLLTTSGVSAAVSVAVSRMAAPEPTTEPRRVPVAAPEPEPEPDLVVEPEPEPDVEPEPEPDGRVALDLLERANRARRSQNWRRADELYGRVQKRHPRSRAAYVAAVSRASIKLEQLDDARGALALYRRAARRSPTGPLAEEADFGIAEAHRRLGNRAAERRALERFLRRHPDSLLAGQARERARGLGGEDR